MNDVLYLVLGTIVFCLVLVMYDEYIYKNKKPKHSLQHIEDKLEEYSKAIEEHKNDVHVSQQSLLDIWDYWDGERTRALKWNKNHPDDRV